MWDIVRNEASNHRDDGNDDHADMLESSAEKASKGQVLTDEEHHHLTSLMHEAGKNSDSDEDEAVFRKIASQFKK
jgi:hypothetical protein